MFPSGSLALPHFDQLNSYHQMLPKVELRKFQVPVYPFSPEEILSTPIVFKELLNLFPKIFSKTNKLSVLHFP